MLWVVVVLVVIFLAFGAAGVRTALKIAAVLFIACVLLIAVYFIHQKSEREAAKSRISFSEVRFDDLRLGIGSGTLSGEVRNRSQRYTLTSVGLLITVRDCIQGSCDVVGQESETLWMDVPPGQVRAVDHYVYFPHLPPRRGDYQWDYRITSVEGRE